MFRAFCFIVLGVLRHIDTHFLYSRFRFLFAWLVVCGWDVRELCLLGCGGGQANGGSENSCGSDLHDDMPSAVGEIDGILKIEA